MAGSLTRRQLLRLGGTAAAALTLAACGSAAASPPPSGSSAVPSGARPEASAARPAASAAASASGQAQAPARKLVVASTTVAGSQSPIWLAENLHYWEKLGLTVERKRVQPDIGTKALVSKDIDVLIQAPAAIIPANVNGNLDLVYIASIFNNSQIALSAKPSIKSAADLKGKIIATDKIGTATDYALGVMLAKLNIKRQEVELPTFPTTEAIYAALIGGKVDAASMGVPNCFYAEGAGFPMLADTFDTKYQNIGPVIERSRLEELAPALRLFLVGLRQGMVAYREQPDLAKKLISQNTQETDPALLQKSYDFYAKTNHYEEDLEPTMEGMQTMIDFLGGTVVPGAKGLKAAQLVDRRILESLPKS
jgi:ABC-type nitrate/sulfonate/bicarbonate transport system substrate-binding protein